MDINAFAEILAGNHLQKPETFWSNLSIDPKDSHRYGCLELCGPSTLSNSVEEDQQILLLLTNDPLVRVQSKGSVQNERVLVYLPVYNRNGQYTPTFIKVYNTLHATSNSTFYDRRQKVKLLEDLPKARLAKGSIGVVLLTYDSGAKYEVRFQKPNGRVVVVQVTASQVEEESLSEACA